MKGRVLMCHELPGISVPLDSLWEQRVALVSFFFNFVLLVILGCAFVLNPVFKLFLNSSMECCF